jgi:lactoylglutathione lyase
MAKICAISIYAHDLDKAADFYSGVLGLKVKHKMPYVVVLDHDGVDLVLCQAEKLAQPNYPAGSGVVLGFPTNNLADSIKNFKAKGVALVHDAPQEFPEGHFVAFRDPSGNVHELLEFKK